MFATITARACRERLLRKGGGALRRRCRCRCPPAAAGAETPERGERCLCRRWRDVDDDDGHGEDRVDRVDRFDDDAAAAGMCRFCLAARLGCTYVRRWLRWF